MRKFDVLIIGGGSGGLRSARRAAKLGFSVGLVEKSKLGGTCVNCGCLPKKIMYYSSTFGNCVAQIYRHGNYLGWQADNIRHDFGNFMDRMRTEVMRASNSYDKLLGKCDITLIRGNARFVRGNLIEVEGEQFTGDNVIIAVGGRPATLNIPGKELIMVSDDVFNLTERPNNMVIIGGGYISLEFASIFNFFGTNVTIVCRSGLLGSFDRESADFLGGQLVRNGINIITNTNVTKVTRSSSSLLVYCSNGEVIRSDKVLSAIGRIPNTESSGLTTDIIKLDDKKRVVVDSLFCTSVAGVYAVGDVTSVGKGLTPTAIKEAEIVVGNLYNKGKHTNVTDFNYIPKAVFTLPSLSCVGLTEELARQWYGDDVSVLSRSFITMQSRISGDMMRSFFKVIIRTSTEEILGVYAIGVDVAEIVQSLSVAFSVGVVTKKHLDTTIALHPTLAEELLFVRQRD